MIGIALSLLLAPSPSGVSTSPPPSGPGIDVRLGPVTFEQYSELRFPGLYAPTFDLVTQPRWMHVFSLRPSSSRWSWLSIETRVIESAGDGSLSGAIARMPTPERSGAMWTGVRADVPRTLWRVEMGRSWRTGAAQAIGGLRSPRGGLLMLGLSRRLR
jgi:hypothetical protein